MKFSLRDGVFIFILCLFLTMCKSEKDDKKYKIPTEEELFQFTQYIISNDLNGIEEYFAKGYSPDICKGITGWTEANPLWLICGDDRDVYEMFKLVLKTGADVNMRPYIWHTLDIRILTKEDIEWLNDIKDNEQKRISGITLDAMYKRLSLLIEYGADVDCIGAPNRLLFPSTEKAYQKYFKKEGSRPIELAIKKNLPTILDMLLVHSKIGLTEESLKAAERTKDDMMIEKITRLWRMQKNSMIAR